MLTREARSDFVWVRAVHMLIIDGEHESRSRRRWWSLEPEHLKARAHADIFGTRVCRADSAWLGARARAGGRAHVAAVEGSWVAMY